MIILPSEPDVKNVPLFLAFVITKVSTVDAVASCDCGDKIKVLESKVEVLAQYMKTFNVFLNQSMISNSVDGSAEEGLTQVMDNYPVS